MKRATTIFALACLLALGVHAHRAAAQGVTPGSSPFRYDFPNAYFNYGGVALPRSVPGGYKGLGTINAQGLYVNGTPVMALGSAITPAQAPWAFALDGSRTVTGNVFDTGPFALDMRFSSGARGTPLNGSYHAAGGNAISYVPLIQGVGTAISAGADGNYPTNDHQRATGLLTSVTSDDGHSQENTLGIETSVSTGYNTAWSANASFANGANIYVLSSGGHANGIYRQVSGSTCTSGSMAPFGFGNASQQQTDGSCTWQWINANNVAAKVGIYSEETVNPGAGNTWNLALNTLLTPNTPLSFHANAELDFGNNSGECFGSSNCINLDVETGGAYRSTHAVLIGSSNSGSVYATHFGLRLAGSMLDSDIDFDTDANGAVGIGNCATGFAPCTHSTAGYLDQSSSPIALQFHQPSNVSGTMHSVGTIVDDTTSPTTLSIAGTKSLAGLYVHPTAPIGIKLSDGTFSQYQLQGTGWTIDPTGIENVKAITAANYITAQVFTETSPPVPTSSSSFCNVGQHAWDQNYEYRCVAASTWKRTALSAF